MQNTTADYKIEINKPSRSFECKITIGNNIYTNEDLVNLTLEYAQPQEGFAIGNTVSQSLDLTLLNKGDIIYSTSQIKVEIGLKIDTTIEYILMGIFNIDDIEKTDYTTKFTCYDNMIKFESAYFSNLGDSPTLQQVVNELVQKTGVQFIGSLPSYTVSKLEGFTCREVLSYVASICGGNAFITRDGKFTIKSLSEAEKAIDGNNYFDYTREEVEYKVGQISCQVDENNILSKGSTGTDSMELQFENPWVTQTILNNIYNELNGLSYLGYSMKWQGDLSLDPYDIITVTDIKNITRKIPILSQKLTYTGGLTSEIEAKGETKNKNSFSSSGSTTNKVNRLITDQAIIKEALIEKASIQDLEAVSIRTQTLEAKTAKIEEAIIDVAYVSDLTAINANIQTLFANDATINNALINKADITDLTAINIKFDVASGGTLDLQTLLSRFITGENGQFINISSSNSVIANATIKNAMIESLSVDKLLAGRISTNKFTVSSDDGGIEIVGATQQFKDKNNKVRIQMGQDTQGNFNFILRGEDGTTTLIDHTGIKENAIADKLIKSNMVADGAIGEQQINYSSLVTGLNKDTNTQLIKASKVAIDLTGQSLEVAFNSLKSNVDNIEIGGRNLLLNSTLCYTAIPNGSNFAHCTVNNITSASFTIDNGLHYTATATNGAINSSKGIRINSKDFGFNIGDTFAYSVDLKGKFGSSNSGLAVMHATITNSNFYAVVSSSIAHPTTLTDWTRKSRTYTIPSNIKIEADGSFYIYLFFGGGTGSEVDVYAKNVKIEKGNKATDWTPAPEDIEQKIESNTTAITVAQGKIEGLISENSIIKGDVTTISDKYTSLKATVDGINTTVANHSSSIGTINTNIAGLSGKVATVENKYTSLSQDLSGFKTTVGNTYSTKSELSNLSGTVSSINSRVSTAESSITQLNNKIALKVEATDVKEAINNLQFGGRNLVLDTNTPIINLNWSSNGWQGDITAYSDKTYKLTASNGWRVHKYKLSKDYAGKKITISFYAKLLSNETTSTTINGLWVSNDTGTNPYLTSEFTMIGNTGTYDLPVKDTWIYCYASVVLNNDCQIGICVRCNPESKNLKTTWIIKELKIEEGNKPSAWTPAPEDIDNAISEVDTKITTTVNKVATIETNLSSITQRVSSTESTVSTHTTELGKVDNKISTAINDIQVGGRNLVTCSTLRYTSKPSNANFTEYTVNNIAGSKFTNDGYYYTATANNGAINSSRGIKINSKDYGLKVGDIIAFSSEIKGKFGTSNSGFTIMHATTTNSNFYAVIHKEFSHPTSVPNWTRKNIVYKIPNNIKIESDGSFYLYLFWGGGTGSDVEVWVRNIKIELGNKATDWTPAPEDVDSSINTVDTKVETTKNKVSTIETNLSSITSRVSSTESSMTTINGNVTSLQSRVSTAESKLTATSLTTTISSAISSGTSSITTTQFVMDKNGLTIKNGSLTIKNNAGTTVLSGDTSGNLKLAGSITSGATITGGILKSSNGDMYFDMNNGYMLLYNSGIKIGQTNKNNITGTSIYGVSNGAEYGNYSCLSAKTSSTASTYTMMITASGADLTGTNIKKGVNFGYDAYFNGWDIDNPGIINNPTAIKWDNTSSKESRIYTSSNNLYIRCSNSDTETVKITCNHSNAGHKAIAYFGYNNANKNGIDFWQNLNMNNWKIYNSSISAYSIEANDIEMLAPFTMYSEDGEEIKYTATKSLIANTEYFGSGEIINGECIINLPAGILIGEKGYIVTLIPIGKKDIWLESKDYESFTVKGEDCTFDYLIKAHSPSIAMYRSNDGGEEAPTEEVPEDIIEGTEILLES